MFVILLSFLQSLRVFFQSKADLQVEILGLATPDRCASRFDLSDLKGGPILSAFSRNPSPRLPRSDFSDSIRVNGANMISDVRSGTCGHFC
jgi:hypothetical protein